MKKLVVLLVAMLVAAGLWAQAAAPAAPAYPTWVFNGNFNYGVLTDGEDVPMQFADMRTIWKINLDANNFVQMRLRFKDANFSPELGSTAGSNTLQAGIRADQAYVQTNLTGAFGVTGPVTASIVYGFVNHQFSDITGGISPFEVADLSGNDSGDRYQPIIHPSVTIANMLTFDLLIAPNSWMADGPRYNQGYEAAIYGTQGPVGFEIGYGNIMAGGANNNPRASKVVWAGLKYTQTAGDLMFAAAANGQMNIDSNATGFSLRNHFALAATDATEDSTYGYGVAAMVNYMKGLVIAKAGLVGIQGAMVNRAEGQLIIQPIPQLALDVGAVVNLNDDYRRYYGAGGPNPANPATGTTPADVKMLNDLDVAVIINAGKVPYRIGYLYKDKNAPYSVQSDDIGRVGDANKLGTVDQGGAYISVILAY